jgi:hypothetical protein
MSKDNVERIVFALAQFKGMGATADELEKEENKLKTNAAYYHTWCTMMHDWCDPCPFPPKCTGAVVGYESTALQTR